MTLPANRLLPSGADHALALNLMSRWNGPFRSRRSAFTLKREYRARRQQHASTSYFHFRRRGSSKLTSVSLQNRQWCRTLPQTWENSGERMWLGRQEMKMNLLTCLALQYSWQNGNMGLPRMLSNPAASAAEAAADDGSQTPDLEAGDGSQLRSWSPTCQPQSCGPPVE